MVVPACEPPPPCGVPRRRRSERAVAANRARRTRCSRSGDRSASAIAATELDKRRPDGRLRRAVRVPQRPRRHAVVLPAGGEEPRHRRRAEAGSAGPPLSIEQLPRLGVAWTTVALCRRSAPREQDRLAWPAGRRSPGSAPVVNGRYQSGTERSNEGVVRLATTSASVTGSAALMAPGGSPPTGG